jgi:hypothetical protein
MMAEAVKPACGCVGVSGRISFSVRLGILKKGKGSAKLTDPLTDPFFAKAVKILRFDAPEACSWQASTPRIESVEKVRMSGSSSLPGIIHLLEISDQAWASWLPAESFLG